MTIATWKEIANYLGKSVRTVQRWHYEKVRLHFIKTSPAMQGKVQTSERLIAKWLYALSHKDSPAYKRNYQSPNPLNKK